MRHIGIGVGLTAALVGLLLVVACGGPAPTPVPTPTATPTPDIRPTVEAVMKAPLDDIKKELALLNSELVKLGSRLGGVEGAKGQVAAIESSLSSLSKQIVKLEGDATVTKSSLDKTKADLDLASQVLLKVIQTLENPPSGAAIVLQAVKSTKSGDACWSSGGYAYYPTPTPTPPPPPINTFYVLYSIERKSYGVCYHPLSVCATEVRIGLPLPRSCGG